jgi:PAS domain S-box-containing protein
MKLNFHNFIIFIFLITALITGLSFGSISLAQDSIERISQEASNNKVNLTAEEKLWLKAHPEISIAVRHGYSPIEFVFELEEFRGFSIDYLKKLELMLGIKFNKRMANQNLAANDTDMLSLVTNVPSLEGTKFSALETPFLKSSIGIFTKRAAPKLDGINDLHGKKVAVFKTGFIAKRLAEDHPEINLYLVDIAEEALDAVITGKVDAYIGNTIIINYVLKSNENETVAFNVNTPYSAEFYMAVRSDWPILKAILEKSLRTISEKEHAEILDKWTKVTYLSKVNYELVASIIAVSILLLTIFFISNRRLKNEVKRRIELESSLIQSKVQAEQAEETIRRYSKDLERLAMVAKHTTDSVVITDAEGKTLWANQAFTRLTGYSLEEVLNRKPGQLLQGKETSPQSIQLLRDAEKSFSDIEIELINYRKNGEKYWVRLKISAIVNAYGERRFIAIQTDITKQVNYIKTIENNQEDMDALFSISPDGMVVLDFDHRISHVNAAFVAMTGLQSRNLVGLNESDLDTFLKAACTEPKEYKSINEFAQIADRPDMKFRYGDGTANHAFKFQLQYPLQLTLERSCIETNQKRISRVIYFKDVTQRAIIENMKSEFITTAAHELRTPMSVILGYAELLKMKTFTQDVQIEMVEAIHNKSELVASLLDDLLDVAVIEYRAEKTLKLELHALKPFIKSITDTFIFPGNDNRVSLDSIPEVDDFYFDAQRFERVINNCLTNAYKFSPANGAVEMRLYLLESAVPELAIEIQDYGIGMNPEQLSRIFEKFYRADRSGHVPGTGLGMVLVKDIMEAHGGRVFVESELDAGTKVTLILPMRTSIE